MLELLVFLENSFWQSQDGNIIPAHYGEGIVEMWKASLWRNWYTHLVGER